MAANVFGIPMTKLTLEVMPAYEGKEITRFDLAREAYHLKNGENKAVNAHAYVNNLVASYGTGACTRCLIYNATGEPITLVGSHDWNGKIAESSYPVEIANGQWAAFLHAGDTSGSSVGAVVYRLKGVNGSDDEDCMAAWCTASGPSDGNHCYTEFTDKDQFNDTVWEKVETKMTESGHHLVETCGFFRAEVTMGNHATSDWVAILKVGDPY